LKKREIPSADYDQQNPFHYLFENFDNDVIRARQIAIKLIANGVQPNKKNKNLLTPIHLAIKNKQIEALKFAINFNLQKGKEIFDFSLTSKYLWTIFHLSAYYNCEDFYEMFVWSPEGLYL